MADQGTGQGWHWRDRPLPGATVNATDAAKEMTQKMALRLTPAIRWDSVSVTTFS